ncbi:MAG: hypothetical protein WKF82_06460 [Nocardioidaceae bacterium]
MPSPDSSTWRAEQTAMEIIRVQRWVASALALTVAYVWSSGMVLGALYTVDQTRSGAQIGILVVATVVNLAAIVGVRVINGLPLVTWWLIAGFVPTAVGMWALSRR